MKLGITYYDDLHWDRHPDLLHVLEVQLFHNNQEHSADQGIDQGGHIGLGEVLANIDKRLEGREERAVIEAQRGARDQAENTLPNAPMSIKSRHQSVQ